MAGSKEVPASRPTSRSEGLKTLASSLDALTGRVSALEVMMGAERRLMPATNVQTSVPSDEVPSAPSMPSADAQVAAPSDQVPSAPSMPSADAQVAAPSDQVPSAPAMPSADVQVPASADQVPSAPAMPSADVQVPAPADQVPSAPAMPSSDAQVPAPADQVPSEPSMPSSDAQVPVPADQAPSAPSMPSADAQVLAPGVDQAPVEPDNPRDELRPSKTPPERPVVPRLVGLREVQECVEESHDLEEKLSFLEFHSRSPEQSSILNEIVQDVRLCLKRCELILQLPEIKAFIKKFQSSLQVNAVLHDSWLGPTKSRLFEDEEAPKIEPCKSTGDLTSVAADPFHARPAVKRGEFNKRPFRTVNDWARPHTPLTLDPRGKAPPSLPEIPR
ncbi:unnamed protein product [Durusdinium trenchii]